MPGKLKMHYLKKKKKKEITVREKETHLRKYKIFRTQ